MRKRQRRQQQRQQRQQRMRPAREPVEASSHADAWEPRTVDAVVARLVEAAYQGHAGADDLLARLVAGPSAPGGRELVARRLTLALTHPLAGIWQKGWEPWEVHRLARRRIGRRGAAAVAAAIAAAGGTAHPLPGAGEWTLEPAQPSWAADVATVIATLGLLQHLPPLPRVGHPVDPRTRENPLSGQAQRVLEKVRALLAKAESTGFPEEAEAFTAKAQELLAHHSIDRAAVDAGDPGVRQRASVRRIWIDEPYITAKALLLHVVAQANRCRAALCRDPGFSSVAGHDDDLGTVELLFTSLLVQATAAMTAAGARRNAWGQSRTRAFRQSFLVAYAHRIGARLREVNEKATTAAAEQHGRDLLPVLASRSRAADDAIDAMFGKLASIRSTIRDREGWVAGTAAADLASLSIGRPLPGSSAT